MLPLAASLGVALLLAAVHAGVGALHLRDRLPRSGWLSFAGGVGVAYVFLHILPELHEGQRELEGVVEFLEHHVYLLALAGLVFFYGMERTAKAHGHAIFWFHIGVFAFYNLLIGYLLVHREDPGLRGLAMYGVAMSLHFLVNDSALRSHHTHRYDRVGRWILGAAALAGWGLGVATEIHGAAVDALFAFLAGGIIMNVLKEELPEERESQFSAFLLATVIYSGIMLL